MSATGPIGELAPADPAPFGYYSVADLMARWNCGRTHAYQQVHSPGFPEPLKLGRHLRYARHEVWAFEADHALTATPSPVTPPTMPPARRPGPKKGSK
jgi:predicted DNA-binding transcriptional regulator AlpA